MQVNDELAQKLEDGIRTINDQHKKIFDFATALFARCTGNDNEENQYFGETVEDAVGLITAHFQTEEDLMAETKFDMYEFVSHKKEHGEFVMTVSEYIKKFQATGYIDLLTFSSYAKWWLIGHIKRCDRKYVEYYNKITEGRGIQPMKV
jgi:hemerythrin